MEERCPYIAEKYTENFPLIDPVTPSTPQ